MRCEHVQPMIWSGEHSIEMTLHIQDCPACQREFQTMKQLVNSLSSLEVPLPSRSLKPSPDVIRQTVKRNRRQRWTKVATIAASVVLFVGVAGAGTAHFANSGGAQPGTEHGTTQHPSDPTAPSAFAQVEIDEATGSDKEILRQVRDYLHSIVPADQVKKITLQSYRQLADSPPAGQNQQRRYTGEVLMDVVLAQPNSSPTFDQGSQSGIVLLNQIEGKPVVKAVEQAIAPKTPDEAVSIWATSQTVLDGTSEYFVLSRAQKDQRRQTYDARHWMTANPGTFASYQITSKKQEENRWLYSISFAQGDGANPAIASLVVEAHNGGWFVSQSELTNTDQTRIYQHQVDLPTGSTIRSGESPIEYGDMQVYLESQTSPDTSIPSIVGNHADIVSQRQVQTAVGTATLVFVNRSEPAASASSKVTQEAMLIAFRDDPTQKDTKIAYLIRATYTGTTTSAEHALLELSAGWKLP